MRNTISKIKPSVWVGLFFFAWSAYFFLFWRRAFMFDAMGNVLATHVNIWGDWAVHFTMGSAMAFRDLFLQDSPLLLDAPFRYPYAANFISALLIRSGVPFLKAFTIPSFFYSVSIVAALFWFYRKLFKSDMLAMSSTCIFLFNGGLGFIRVFQKAFASAHPVQTLLYPAVLATRGDNWQLKWISIIDSAIIPQRAFQIGFPLALLCLSLALTKKHRFWTGILWGFLPIFHMHSFAAVSVILGCWIAGDIFQNKRLMWKTRITFWFPTVLIAVVVAIPGLGSMHLLSGGGPNVIRWFPGWYTNTPWEWSKFWVANWGATPIVAFLGAHAWLNTWDITRNKTQKIIFLVPFIVLFVILNLVLLQPWVWDNTKLLAWVSVGVSGMAAFWVHRQKTWVAITVFGFMILAGAMDAYRIMIPVVNTHKMYTSEEWALSQWVRKNTPPNSRWLTSAYHNNWLFNLTGRQVLITYEGWLWSHGYEYTNIKNDFTQMMLHPEKEGLIKTYEIDYLVEGPIERRDWKLDDNILRGRFTPVHETENYVIYSVKNALAGTGSSLPPGNIQKSPSSENPPTSE